jgi:hypothetical protein
MGKKVIKVIKSNTMRKRAATRQYSKYFPAKAMQNRGGIKVNILAN